MKKVTFVVVLFLCSIYLFAQDDDHANPRRSDAAPTFTVFNKSGNYHQGDIVVRNYIKLGGSAGPFSSLTGHNPGTDPALDTTDWCYLPQGNCGAVIPPTGAVETIASSATSVSVASEAIPQSEGIQGDNNSFCVPLQGPQTLTNSQLPNVGDANQSFCPGGGGGGTLSTPLSGTVTYTFKVLPAVPNDGSSLQMTAVDMSEVGVAGTGSPYFGCSIPAGATSCTGTATIAVAWSVGDVAVMSFLYYPGTSNLPMLALTSASWSISN